MLVGGHGGRNPPENMAGAWAAPVHCQGTHSNVPGRGSQPRQTCVATVTVHCGDSAGCSHDPQSPQPPYSRMQGRAGPSLCSPGWPAALPAWPPGPSLSWDTLPEDRHAMAPASPPPCASAVDRVGRSPVRPWQVSLRYRQQGKERAEAERQDLHFTAGVRPGMFQS